MSEAYGYTRGRILLENLTSFWTKIFGDPAVIQSHLHGHAETLAQAYFDLLEIILAKSVLDIPVFHREKWTLLLFNESDRNRNKASLLTYGLPGVVYGPQPPDSDVIADFTYQYGGFIEGRSSSFDLPPPLVNVESYIMNRIHEPSLIFTAGQDFIIQNKVIFFKENPFENSLVPIREIQDATGTVIDRQIALWALNSDEDRKYLYEYYGSLVDVFFESSENYKQFLQAVFRLFTVGPRIKFLLSTLNALVGLPVIREAKETFVKVELLEDGSQRVVTDRNIYDFAAAVELRGDLVSGLELDAFEHLTEAIQVVDDVSVPAWWNNFNFLPIPVEIISGEHTSSLKLFNELVKMDVTWDATVPIHVVGEMTPERREFYEHFPILWDTGAVWDDPVFFFRPLDFLFRLYWRYNLFLLFIKVNQIPPGKLTSKITDLLSESLPAYVHFLNILEQPFLDEYDLGTESTDDIDLERAHVYSDDYDDAESGFWGLPRWDTGDVWDDVAYYTTVGFLVGPKFFKIETPCAT